MRGFFAPPAYRTLRRHRACRRPAKRPFAPGTATTPSRTRWAGYRAVYISLKKPDVAPGDATDAQMDLIADLADRYSFGEVRVTHTQNLVLADVEQGTAFELWRALDAAGLATPNIGTLTDMICCPGLDFCSLANAGSIDVAKLINERFDDYDYLYDLGEIEIKMSGCMNACGHHHIGNIGILGVDKGGEEWYQITIGGAAGAKAALGTRHRALRRRSTRWPRASRGCWRCTCEQRHPDERFVDTVRRLGVKPFKERVYAATAAA